MNRFFSTAVTSIQGGIFHLGNGLFGSGNPYPVAIDTGTIKGLGGINRNVPPTRPILKASPIYQPYTKYEGKI